MSLKPIPKKKGEKDLAKSQIPLLNKSSLGSIEIFGAPPFRGNCNVVLLKHHLKSHPKEAPKEHQSRTAAALWFQAASESVPAPSLSCFVNLGKSLRFHKPQFFHP